MTENEHRLMLFVFTRQTILFKELVQRWLKEWESDPQGALL
jgi:hypothetical protein